MNAISNLVLSAALATSSICFANIKPAVEVKPLTISAEITQLLSKNTVALHESATFQVTFIVNKKGEVVITDVDTDNLELEQFIKGKLNYRKLKAGAQVGKRYFLPVTFKVS